MYQHATSTGLRINNVHLPISSYEVPLRNYRRSMKPRLARKVTASSRINLNRFWNELEEFYNRYDDRKAKNNNNPIITKVSTELRLPAYTTDTFDHERESAENLLNERLEHISNVNEKETGDNVCCECCCSCRLETNYLLRDASHQRDRIHSCGVESEASSVDDQSSSDLDSELESDDDIFYGLSYYRPQPQHHWNTMSSALPTTPRPPKSLLDLIHRMGPKEF